MIDVIICGASGRTGSNLMKAVLASDEMRLVGAIEATGHPTMGTVVSDGVVISSDLRKVVRQGAVIVEFNAPKATMEHLESIHDQKVAVIIGTTGFTDAQQQRILELSSILPIVESHNYGLGMNFFYSIVQHATRLLKDRFDIEIVEFHGGEKKDAPSGTGKTIAGKIAETKSLDLSKVAVYSRAGLRDKIRERDEIGISSIRGGTYKSDHTVIFAGTGERIELVHREESPEIIVQGVMLAIKYVASVNPGFYGMEHVLDL